ncbi:MAG: hypothetical protein A3F84_01530 [Candidatus Handelsmanbacteria bacterium RIFCSPLOWO2_12_FULL_64_10]|uniref:Alpha-D-phosphohexomutase alpha/beta/alpha domain-containing protein n=1 Tax=Handelsmanbacteria sp. (strain RIFCSPLOWO2_12_FULL_64_10) TaxID=1817868 RepID=A0A1F6D209_HANXR|nr:MAG: hypothetical protein A3F84_01530 [Candidatus Handelsmanbacteria bacterium RIFCSPLOWO2_12_FULL_64_10]
MSRTPDSRLGAEPPPNETLDRAEKGIRSYLREKREKGELAENYYQDAINNVIPNLRDWYTDSAIDRLSPSLKLGIRDAVDHQRWEDLVNAFVRNVTFGTGGIRSLMAFDRASIHRLKDSTDRLKEKGLDARILKGPNTINNVVVLRTAYGVARYLVDRYGAAGSGAPKARAVVGYDSRVGGEAFAKIIAELFLAEGIVVYLFDEPVPYPEVTFAIPDLSADIGTFISASHNDYRYNGFKLSGPNGAQIPPEERNKILKEIQAARPGDIRLARLEEASAETLSRLYFLGGSETLPDKNYYGREGDLVDMHKRHVNQVKRFLLRKNPNGTMQGGADLHIVFAAFNGSGRRAVPRILRELGCNRIHSVTSLDPLNGLFPAFKSDPGEEQQPDPGDPRAARIALQELEKDELRYREKNIQGFIAWADADLLIGTDPDADRCGVIVKPPEPLAAVLRDRPSLRSTQARALVPADDVWALLLWYRLQFEIEQYGAVVAPESKFVALSHTTSDMIAQLARKYGLGVLKTWVGFGWLSNAVAQAWSDRPLPRIAEGKALESDEKCHMVFYDTTGMDPRGKINVATMEQSNGFSILGGPPANPERALGTDGHVRDKDGTFAALLVTEVAAYARQLGTDILSLLAQRVYADPDVGLFVNYYEPDPLDGEYPGLEGDSKKKKILDGTEALYQLAQKGGLRIGGRRVTSAKRYTTGKYDAANWPGFPDEGIRFYFESKFDYLTIRPSGTTNSLRFHVQFYAGTVGPDQVWQRRVALEEEAKGLITGLRERFNIPRPEGVEF